MLFDDYLETVTQADERAVVFLVADDPPATRVWAGSAATWDEMRPHGLRLSGHHFTALFAKEGTIREALLQLPPVRCSPTLDLQASPAVCIRLPVIM